jgi:hypothetical protein
MPITVGHTMPRIIVLWDDLILDLLPRSERMPVYKQRLLQGKNGLVKVPPEANLGSTSHQDEGK